MNQLKVNDTFFQKAILIFLLLWSVLFASALFAQRSYIITGGADRQLERELDRIEGFNHELASETRQLQAEIATHSVRIGNVASRVGNSKKRVQDVCVEN